MKVGSGENLSLSVEYSKKLFGPCFSCGVIVLQPLIPMQVNLYVKLFLKE